MDEIEVVEAEVIEELAPQAIATAGTIETNFERVEARVAELVSNYEGITRENVLAMNVKDAKRERAYLNQAKKTIEDERKRIKKEYTAPLNAFEVRVKEITSLIDKPLALLGECITMQEQAAKDQRREHLQEVFSQFLEGNAIETFAANVTFGMIEKREWLNASYNVKKAENEVCDAIAAIMKEWQGLMSVKETLFCPDETERAFWRTLNLSEALAYDKEQAEAQARIDALHESIGVEPEPEPEPVPDFMQEPEPEYAPAPPQVRDEPVTYVITVTVTESQKRDLVEAMQLLGIHGTIRRQANE